MRNGKQPGDGTPSRSQTPSVQNSANTVHGAIPFAERLTCTIAEACEAAGLGRTKLYELIGEGHLDTTTIGRRRLVLVRWLKVVEGFSACTLRPWRSRGDNTPFPQARRPVGVVSAPSAVPTAGPRSAAQHGR
jgi:excisionase family DNA binding protein